MTTDLEMPATTGKHRHLDEMSMMRSSLLGNAARAYMNSSCQLLLAANDPHNNVGAELPVPMMVNEYKPLFEGHHLGNMNMQLQNVHTMRSELVEGCTLDYSKDNYINVDSVPSYFNTSNSGYNSSTICNNFISTREHENIMKLQHDVPGGLIRADTLNQPLSWASLQHQDSKAHQSPLYVNSYLLDDDMMNDNSTISSLLSSVHPFNNTNQHFSSLNLIPILQSNVSSSFNPLNGAGQLSPGMDEIGQVLDVIGPAPTSRALQALFDDDISFADGQFISAFFTDNEVGDQSKEGSEETAYNNNMGGSDNVDQGHQPAASSLLMQSQVVSVANINAGPFESSENTMANKEATSSDAGYVDAAHIQQEPPYSNKYSSNKRAALTEGEQQLGPPARKRAAGCEVDAGRPPAVAGEVDGPAEPTSSPNNIHNTTSGQLITKSAARANKQYTACDPQSIAARHRRERISERLKILQELIPNGSKVDIVTMLEKAINYVKFLQLQVKVLTTDEYWPNSQKLNQPHEMNLLNLLMSKAKEESTRNNKNERLKEKTSKS